MGQAARKRTARRHHPEPAQAGLELVPATAAPAVREAEQLPLIRMLEIVRDRVESIHESQRTIVEELHGIKRDLPMQRRPLSRRTQLLHVQATLARRNGLCPCCQETPVCNADGRLPGAEFDHFFNRNKNRVHQTWLVCGACNQRLLDTEYKATARSAFESYQQALKPLLNRQMAMRLE